MAANYEIVPVSSVDADGHDALICVYLAGQSTGVAPADKALADAIAYDASAKGQVVALPCPGVAGGRVILAPVHHMDQDGDDARNVSDAASAGFVRAMATGARSPVITVGPGFEAYGVARTTELALLGAVYKAYSPLQNREFAGAAAAEPLQKLGFVAADAADAAAGAEIAKVVTAMDAGRRVARDITGADPERMSSTAAAVYVKEQMEGLPVQYSVEADADTIKREYPLMHAVARCSLDTERHHPRLVRLEYKGEGPITQQVFFSGKGITYDTGGADIKAGGIMSGMKADCGGAAAAAGFVKAVAMLAPKHLRVVAYLAFVRNSVGSNAYVADEIITSRAGRRVLVVNTDAEGRMAMSDPLAKCKEEILESKSNPELAGATTVVHTCATLTGHAVIAVGPYSIAMDNAVARKSRNAQAIQLAGDEWGDVFEVSNMRREDVAMVTPKIRADHDVVQCNTLPSSRTPRGHQFPAAMMSKAAGLDEYGLAAGDKAIAYTHLDIAGSAHIGSSATGDETGAPVVALTARYALA